MNLSSSGIILGSYCDYDLITSILAQHTKLALLRDQILMLTRTWGCTPNQNWRIYKHQKSITDHLTTTTVRQSYESKNKMIKLTELCEVVYSGRSP